jgi:hypothetical protein
MKSRVVRTSAVLLLLAAAVVAPGTAQALLLGDNVTATLVELTGPTTIFTGTATVVEPDPTPPGAEFTGTFAGLGFDPDSNWTLDLLDGGFTLTGTCTFFSGCDIGGLRLTLSGLDFTPPGALVGLLGSTGLLPVSGTPAITPSSVVIEFGAFGLGTGEPFPQPITKSFSASFNVAPQSTVPIPGTLVLVLVGGLGLGAVALRRARA